jgi:hypothetical protein
MQILVTLKIYGNSNQNFQIYSRRDNNTDLSLTQNSGEVTVLPEYFNQNKTIFSKKHRKNNFKKEQLKWESSFAPTFITSFVTKCILKGISNRSGTKFGRENMFNIEYSFNNVPRNVLDNYDNYYLQNFRSFTEIN